MTLVGKEQVVTVPIEALFHTANFTKLTPTTLRQVAGCANPVAHRAGATFYQQGEAPSGLFLLQAGRVKLYRQSKERIQILAIPMPSECFGAESLPTNSPCPCTATALTPTQCIHIPPNDIRHLLAACPDFQEVFLELVTIRLRQFVSLVHDLAFRDVTARLATVLVTRARAEGQPTPDGLRMDRLLTQQDFAAMVGTAREVINRIFKRFESDGLVRLSSRHILILNLEKLNDLARQEAQ
jgi:CRP-like cAMP-binding protein